MIDFYFFRFSLPDLTWLKLYWWHIRLHDAERAGNKAAAVEAATRVIQLGGKV
jgi:hypothetical protein